MSDAGQKIIAGLKDAIAGNFSRVTIDGQTWERRDSSLVGVHATREDVARAIWLAEYKRATGKDRSVAWADGVAEADKDLYRFIADAVLALHAGQPQEGCDKLIVPTNPCLKKLCVDEPFFVLLGRDEQAPMAIEAWADYRAAAEGKSEWTEQAREVANSMRAYRIARKAGLASTAPAAAPASPRAEGDPCDAPMPFPHDRRLAEPDMTEQQVHEWIAACNHEPARRVLRVYLFLREQFLAGPAPQAGCAKEGEALHEFVVRQRAKLETMPATSWSNGYREALNAIERVLGALAAPPPPVAESGWQEIETAPKIEGDDHELIGIWLDGRGDQIQVFIQYDPSNEDSNLGFIGRNGERYGAGGITHWRYKFDPPHIAEKQTEK